MKLVLHKLLKLERRETVFTIWALWFQMIGRSIGRFHFLLLCTIFVFAVFSWNSLLVGGFNSYIPRLAEIGIQRLSRNKIQHHNEVSPSRQSLKSQMSWLSDAFQSLGLDFLTEKLKFQPRVPIHQHQNSSNSLKTGTVVRLGVKEYDAEHSTPVSKKYSTKKNPQATILVESHGVQGDYNHYRSTALSSTPDRAISILTTDILKMLKENGWNEVQEGDLGENVYVDADYTFFQVGQQYKFYTDVNSSKDNMNVGKSKPLIPQNDGVVIEITEKIEPCGNLCRLPYINDEALEPKQRFENCKRFLLWLDEKDGLRGWYGKVLVEGKILLGDSVAPLALSQDGDAAVVL